MEQTIIAIIWDFDKTLIPGYMQDPLFDHYHVDPKAFWDEVNALPSKYKELGIEVNAESIYLNHIITCANQGIFTGLNNELLRELGAKLDFYPGVPEILIATKDIVSKEEEYRLFNISVEHYIVSTGLREMIEGSRIRDQVNDVWGCEFIEQPILSALSNTGDNASIENHESPKVLSQIGSMIDNTSKTRALFEINKGSNKHKIDVNSRMDPDKRRVPFENMIYIADGPSDVPAFSIVKQHGGHTLGVYPDGNQAAFDQAYNLSRDGRIDMFAPADYTKGTPAYMWLTKTVKDIAERIHANKADALRTATGTVPRHLQE